MTTAHPSKQSARQITRPLVENWGALVGFTVLLGGALAVGLGFRPSVETARCAPGLHSMGPRCCAPGQQVNAGVCIGKPTSCPSGFSLHADGCVVEAKRISIPAGTFPLGASDWQAASQGGGNLRMDAFLMDAFEITEARWVRCEKSGACSGRSPQRNVAEPGRPVTRVTPHQAEAFCRSVGGRLPTLAEWGWAATGALGRRFPWGPTGLVCRRSSFGLVRGPCARGGTSAELAGARPAGQSPEGVADLAGNVAEWARARDGHYRALGGSFASRVAGELLVSAAFDTQAPANHIGFRCVYPPS